MLEWDTSQHDVRTSSLHSMEGDPALREQRSLFANGPRVATDPQGRLAAAVVFGRQLALMPAMEVDVLEMMMLQVRTAACRAQRMMWRRWGGCRAPGSTHRTRVTRVTPGRAGPRFHGRWCGGPTPLQLAPPPAPTGHPTPSRHN